MAGGAGGASLDGKFRTLFSVTMCHNGQIVSCRCWTVTSTFSIHDLRQPDYSIVWGVHLACLLIKMCQSLDTARFAVIVCFCGLLSVFVGCIPRDKYSTDNPEDNKIHNGRRPI